MIKIVDKIQCSGCYACKNICPKNCIAMVSDTEGFWYPKVNEDICIQCNMCVNVCPILQKEEKMETETVAYACFNKDEEIRYKSSSGGVFTSLATKVLEKEGIVFGAAFNEEFQVNHCAVDKIEDLHKLRGSKYMQSKIGDNYKLAKEYLDAGRWVYFSGTPCQIDGLKKFLKKNYDKLICQDIICHGVPSPKVFERYLNEKNKQYNQKVENLTFRSKVYSWPNYAVKIDFADRSYIASHKNDYYMKAFLSDLILRPSCYQCNSKGINRNSDITLADFWGVKNVLPKMNDRQGVSLVIIHSDKGKEIFAEIMDEIYSEKVDVLEAIKYNPSMCISSNRPVRRDEFLSNIDNDSFEKYSKKYTDEKLFDKIIRNCKRIIRRIVK